MPEHDVKKKRACLSQEFSMIILAGGASSRMGKEKSDLLFQGKTFLEIQIEKGKKLGAKKIYVSGYRGNRCSEEIIPDRIPGQGPLGGLESCLRKAETEKCLVLSVDTPLIPEEALYQLRAVSMQETEKKVTMLCHNGKEESLMAVYDASLCDNIEVFLQNGKSSVYRFLNETGYALYHTAYPENFFENINDPESYLKLCRGEDIVHGK